MNKLWLLLKTGLKNQLKLAELKNRAQKSIRRNTILLASVFLLLGILLLFYAGGSAYGLLSMGMEELIGPAAVTAVSLFTLFFSILKTNGLLFGYKNYDMLASLPIKTSTLVASRFLQLYFGNLLIAMLIMLPTGLVYGICCNRSIFFYFLWFLSIPAVPLIPTTIAAAIGVLIMAAASRMRHPQAVSGFLSVLLIAGVLIGSLSLGNTGTEIGFTGFDAVWAARTEAFLLASLFSVYPVNRLFHAAVTGQGLAAFLPFLLFVLGSYVWYLLFTRLTARFYGKIQAGLTSHKKQGRKMTVRVYASGARPPVIAIFWKEWRRFLSSNVYLTNIGVGLIMLVIVTAALVFLPQDKLTELLAENSITVNGSLKELIGVLAPFIIAGLSGMCCATSCSLSLEGANIEMVKALPIKPLTLFQGKILMNFSLLAPVSFLCALLLSLRFGNNIFQILLLFLLPLVFNCFTSVWGMFVNLHFPNYTWENETVVIKQSAASFLGIFGPLLAAVLSASAVMLLPLSSRNLTTLLITLLFTVVTALLYGRIAKSRIP